jgi:hypothetical protein
LSTFVNNQMSNALKLWPITVTHPRTKRTIKFLGQGKTVLEAVTDGAKNCGEAFRPSQSGGAMEAGEKGGPTLCTVYDERGNVLHMALRDFEMDPPAPAGPESETLDFA